MQQYLTTLLIIVAKLSIIDVCGGPGYNSGNSATRTKCKGKKVQYAKSATGEECKSKTLHRVKVKHEIVQYIKRVQHEKKCKIKIVQYEENAT